jgi:hypothetical protein
VARERQQSMRELRLRGGEAREAGAVLVLCGGEGGDAGFELLWRAWVLVKVCDGWADEKEGRGDQVTWA